MIAGIKGYNNMVRTEENGGRKINRPRWEGQHERRYKKLGAKMSWFKKKSKRPMGKGNGAGKKRPKEEESEIETVLFVPHTPNGTLARLLQEEDDRFRRGTTIKKIKMVERGGITVKDILSKTNPWSDEGCERSDCLPCRGERGKGGNCQKENVVYRITCQECGTRQVKAEYTGETSRTAYLRGREHWDGLEKEKEKNALWKHCVEEHGGNKVIFSMKVIRGHKAPLSRQVHESVEIECSKAKHVLNSKGEWNGSRIPRLRIEVGEELEEEKDDTLSGTSSKITARRWPGDKKNWSINNEKKRSGSENREPPSKRRRADKSPDEVEKAENVPEEEKETEVRKGLQNVVDKKKKEVRKSSDLSRERELIGSWLRKRKRIC